MLRDLAAAAGMSAAKAHRYLLSLQCLGLDAITLLDAVKLARERLPALMQHIGRTLALAVWGNHGPTIVHREESPQAFTVNLRLGDVMPLLSSATGRCFAAYVSRQAIAPLLRRDMALARQLGRSDLPRTQAELNAMLKDIQCLGMARVLDTLLPGVAVFCAPVFDFDGHLVLGIVTTGSVASFDTAWNGAVATTLGQAAPQLSHELGHTI